MSQKSQVGEDLLKKVAYEESQADYYNMFALDICVNSGLEVR